LQPVVGGGDDQPGDKGSQDYQRDYFQSASHKRKYRNALSTVAEHITPCIFCTITEIYEIYRF
jgi:hypothetical protein